MRAIRAPRSFYGCRGAVGPGSRYRRRYTVSIHDGDAVTGEADREGRLVVESARRAELGNLRVVHVNDLIGHRQRLLLVVSDVDDAQTELLLYNANLLAHATAKLGVEIRERLVEDEDSRLEHQC